MKFFPKKKTKIVHNCITSWHLTRRGLSSGAGRIAEYPFSLSRRNLFETIKYEEKGAVGLITLNQPKKLNAMSQVTYGEFPKALEAAAKNDDVKILAIIGEGKFYTSGTNKSLTFSYNFKETRLIRPKYFSAK